MGYLLPTTWTLAVQCSLRNWHGPGLLTIYWQVYISAWSRACLQGALPEQDTVVTNADLLSKTCLVVCWCKQILKCRKRLPGLCGNVSPHLFGIKSALSMRLRLWGGLGLKIFGSRCRPLIILCRWRRSDANNNSRSMIILGCIVLGLKQGCTQSLKSTKHKRASTTPKDSLDANLVRWTVLLAGGEKTADEKAHLARCHSHALRQRHQSLHFWSYAALRCCCHQAKKRFDKKVLEHQRLSQRHCEDCGVLMRPMTAAMYNCSCIATRNHPEIATA